MSKQKDKDIPGMGLLQYIKENPELIVKFNNGRLTKKVLMKWIKETR